MNYLYSMLHKIVIFGRFRTQRFRKFNILGYATTTNTRFEQVCGGFIVLPRKFEVKIQELISKIPQQSKIIKVVVVTIA